MTTSLQLEMGLSAARRNRYRFSDHYLNYILPTDPRWDEALPEVTTFLAWAQDLYAKERDRFDEYTESQLEQYWFPPILAHLGLVFETRPTVPPLEDHAKRPDYVFFPTGAVHTSSVMLTHLRKPEGESSFSSCPCSTSAGSTMRKYVTL
jgi:hypothetical protein